MLLFSLILLQALLVDVEMFVARLAAVLNEVEK